VTSAVNGAVGVVSTIAGVSSANKQQRIQAQQARVQQYASEVQYETQKMAMAQQREYSRQQQALAEVQYRVEDTAARLALKEQELQGLMGNAQAVFANKQQTLQEQSRYQEAMMQAQQQQYAVNEQARAIQGQALSASQQANDQTAGQLSQVTEALRQGDRERAAMLAMQAAQGQSDTVTGGLLSNDTRSLVEALKAKAEAGRFTEDDLQQLQYNTELSGLLQELGLNEVDTRRMQAQNSLDYANTVGRMNDTNLGYQQQQNALGTQLAQSTLDATSNLRNQQMGIDRTFADLGYSVQLNNMSAANAAQQASYQAMSQSSKGNGLLSALAIGGSLFNAAAPYIYKPPTFPTSGRPAATNREPYVYKPPGLPTGSKFNPINFGVDATNVNGGAA